MLIQMHGMGSILATGFRYVDCCDLVKGTAKHFLPFRLLKEGDPCGCLIISLVWASLSLLKTASFIPAPKQGREAKVRRG